MLLTKIHPALVPLTPIWESVLADRAYLPIFADACGDRGLYNLERECGAPERISFMRAIHSRSSGTNLIFDIANGWWAFQIGDEPKVCRFSVHGRERWYSERTLEDFHPDILQLLTEGT